MSLVLPLVALLFSVAALIGLRMVLDYHREARPITVPPTVSADVLELREKIAKLEGLVSDIQITRIQRR